MALYPANGGEWLRLGLYLAGGLVGSVYRPLTWPIGPLRWLAYLTMTASQESVYGSYPDGDGGGSRGIAHFQEATATGLGYASTSRDSPFTSGLMSAAYVQRAVWYDPFRWGAVYLPVIGAAQLRRLWTGGYDASGNLATAWASFVSEGRSLGTYVGVRILTLAVCLLLRWVRR